MPQKFVIKGGNPLTGTVRVRGAKNSVSKLLIASLLTKDEVKLTNVPLSQETEIALELCENIGSIVKREADTITIRTPDIRNYRVKELSRKNRVPILALGPLLVRAGEAEVPMVGGDKIGPRPIDFHIASLEKLGATIEVNASTIVAKAKNLSGATIVLPYPSVGATENSILAAVLAEGRTTIVNAATEPEIIDMIKMLQNMGAIIELGANRTIYIDGVEELHGVEHRLIADRLEAVSFAVMALATNGNILVQDAVQEHLIAFLNAVRRMGAKYEVEPEDGIRFYRNEELKATDIETDTYPGFATDWQQPTAVLLTQARGTSIIHETVYEDRFGYTEDLNRMGAKINVETKCLGILPCRFQGKDYKHSAVIQGPTSLKAADIVMRDIRAGMAQVIAALIADGVSEVSGVEHIDRGYEKIDERIRALGGDLKRIG
ncbi:MAG: UDP-N-acetylglucosamine 1-carboxyvinyltransferase [Patescibacteria group bacterium]|nr:UDP-N-acetylglucosamine 1-carboxyvinyltransferase [Patescibacteria group bacterium]MCL5261812.1 UDP-N-acetylglucosamine 1-carboxyvinyltransferase [Patescibacteria group bacterium]